MKGGCRGEKEGRREGRGKVKKIFGEKIFLGPFTIPRYMQLEPLN